MSLEISIDITIVSEFLRNSSSARDSSEGGPSEEGTTEQKS